MPVKPATGETEKGGLRCEASLGIRLVRPYFQISWVYWGMPITPATEEVKIG
jgi:hypothetical protein